MKKISFGKLVGGLLAARDSKAATPWRPDGKPYPRLSALDVDAEGLRGQPGIYAVWHLGVRPQWLRVGASDDLATALKGLAALPWIAQHQGNGGIFVAWSFAPPEQSAGMVRYLSDTLRPAFQAEAYAADRAIDPQTPPVEIPLPPGTR